MAEFFGRWAWLTYTISTLVCLSGAATLLWRVADKSSRRYTLILALALTLYAIGFALVGMQAGDRPFMPAALLLPWVRLVWSIAGIVAWVFLTIYWTKRLNLIRGDDMAFRGWIKATQTLPDEGKIVEVETRKGIVLATIDKGVWRTVEGSQIDVEYWRRRE